MSGDKDPTMAIGLAFGAIVAAALRCGVSADEVRRWTESAVNSWQTSERIVKENFQ